MNKIHSGIDSFRRSKIVVNLVLKIDKSGPINIKPFNLTIFTYVHRNARASSCSGTMSRRISL